jgi:hypothetical protein
MLVKVQFNHLHQLSTVVEQTLTLYDIKDH